MTKKTQDEASSVVSSTAGSAASSVVTASAALLGFDPALAAGVAVFASAIPGIIHTGFKQRAVRRCSQAQDGITKAAVEYEVDLSDLEASEETEECFLSMFYDMMDAVDDAAAGPLGHMAMVYAARGQKPDSFFRALGRCLRELDGREIQALQILLQECVTRIDSGRASYADSEIVRTDTKDPNGKKILAGGANSERWSAIMETTNGLRLLTVMKQAGLAVEPVDVSGVWGGNPVAARIWKDKAVRALEHLLGGGAGTSTATAPADSEQSG